MCRLRRRSSRGALPSPVKLASAAVKGHRVGEHGHREPARELGDHYFDLGVEERFASGHEQFASAESEELIGGIEGDV